MCRDVFAASADRLQFYRKPLEDIILFERIKDEAGELFIGVLPCNIVCVEILMAIKELSAELLKGVCLINVSCTAPPASLCRH